MPHHDRKSGQPWPKTYPKRYANAMRMLCGVLTISSQKCIHPTLDPGWKNSQITKENQSSNAISGVGELPDAESYMRKTIIQCCLNEAAMKINETAMQIHEITMEIDELALKINEIAIQIDERAMAINAKAMKICEIAIEIDEITVEINEIAMRMQCAYCKLH